MRGGAMLLSGQAGSGKTSDLCAAAKIFADRYGLYCIVACPTHLATCNLSNRLRKTFAGCSAKLRPLHGFRPHHDEAYFQGNGKKKPDFELAHLDMTDLDMSAIIKDNENIVDMLDASAEARKKKAFLTPENGLGARALELVREENGPSRSCNDFLHRSKWSHDLTVTTTPRKRSQRSLAPRS
jgi:Helicase